MAVLGAISSGFDSELTKSAAESLKKACDKVYILDGPILGSESDDKATNLAFALPLAGYRVRNSNVPFESDAAKRTVLLKWLQHENHPSDWVIVLDSDEVLIWGEYMRDFLALADVRPITAAGGFPLRLVEFDGSVALTASRVYKLGNVDHYDLSVHTLTLKGSQTPIVLPSRQVCYMHGIAMQADKPECRPPLQGEPHILHRTMLRNPTRQAQRQHEAEGAWFDERIPSGSNPDS